MSTRPVEELLERVAETDRLAEVVEAHLDAHPLPVDEGEADRIAARLEARLRPRRSPWVRGFALAAVALAAGLVGLAFRVSSQVEPVEGPVSVPGAAVLVTPPAPTRATPVSEATPDGLPLSRRALEIEPGSDVHVLDGTTAIVLVRSGAAHSDGETLPAGHWGLLAREADGAPVTAVFRDGAAPPALDGAVWGPDLPERLRDARFDLLPVTTLEALDALLEDR